MYDENPILSRVFGGSGSPGGGRYNPLMPLLGAHYVVALEPSSVAGAAVARGLGSPRIRALARMPLPAGALEVSPFEPNVRRPDEVRDALARVAGALGLDGRRVCVVLPDGVARLALLQVPPDAEPEGFARFKLAAALSYPTAEAVVDVLPLGASRVLAAAVRRSVIEGYEEAVRAAGVAQERVDLAPLAAMAALARASAPPGVDVMLGEAAVSLAARLDGSVRAFRNRRRDPSPGEPQRLLLEVARTAALAGDGRQAPRVRVLGPGAAAMVRSWRDQGGDAELAWRVAVPDTAADPAEMAWLGAALS
jgi:hypothetical protein